MASGLELEGKGERSPMMMSSRGSLEDEMSCAFRCCPSTLSCFLSSIFPCAWMGGCVTVPERHEYVVLSWGKFSGKIVDPGIYCLNPCGTSAQLISTQKVTIDLPNSKILDLNGNPVIVSAIITYSVCDTKRAALDVRSVHDYIKTQALAALRTVVSRFPYESHDGTPNLRADSKIVSRQMTEALQEKSNLAGVEIVSFDLTDMSYAPEIAAALLVKQQASAVVAARTTIVAGAVSITESAISGLESKGFEFTPAEKARLVSNLLVTLCSETKATPTMTLS